MPVACACLRTVCSTAVSYTHLYAILPNPSQKVPSYAIVRASTMEIGYVDKKRKIAGEDRMLIPDGLLQCDTGVSGKEVIDTVTRVVEEVAEEHGANTAVALAKVKAAVAEKVEDDEELPPWDIVDEVFEDCLLYTSHPCGPASGQQGARGQSSAQGVRWPRAHR